MNERRKFEWFDRIVRSTEAPNEKDRVGWLDISVPKRHILKYWLNGEWRPINIYLKDIIDIDEDFITGETNDRLYTPDPEDDDDVINVKYLEDETRYIVTSNYQYDEVGDPLYEFELEHVLMQIVLTSNNETWGGASFTGTGELNTHITIKANPTNRGYFIAWSDGNTEPERRIKVKDNITLEAIFAPIMYKLTITKATNNGAITITKVPYDSEPVNTNMFESGTTVKLHAFADMGYQFAEWVNADDPTERHTENPYQIIENSYIRIH